MAIDSRTAFSTHKLTRATGGSTGSFVFFLLDLLYSALNGTLHCTGSTGAQAVVLTVRALARPDLVRISADFADHRLFVSSFSNF